MLLINTYIITFKFDLPSVLYTATFVVIIVLQPVYCECEYFDNTNRFNMEEISIEKMLANCGDFSRYQLMLLGMFAIINVLSSVNYYAQTIISFVPEHW